MDRTVWIIVAVVALAVAGFFGYRAHQSSQLNESERQRTEELEKNLADTRLAAKEAAQRAEKEQTAREMAEAKARQVAEADARKAAQAQADRDAAELARKQAEELAAKSAQEMDRIRADKARLEAEARRLEELRAKERADAQAKLEAAQRALAETERQKNAEIERQAAVIASYAQRPVTPTPGSSSVTSSGEATREPRTRYIFPGDFKRTPHYNNLLLLPTE
jgi:fused signal recognition particle receptor